MPIGKFLWGASSSGTTFENVLTFGFPPYNWITDRPPREGSQWVQAPSGTEDAWITGRDYVLEGDYRWIPDNTAGTGGTPSRSVIAGAVQWTDFLDYCRAKNTFRFVPDVTYPNFYVDSCYLIDPMRGFGGNNARLERDVRLVIRNASLDFTQAMRGIMFEYAPGMSLTDPATLALTRATAATYLNSAPNLMSDAPSGILRDRNYISGTRVTLIEPQSTNIVDHSDMDDANGSTAAGGSTIVGGSTTHPLHGTKSLKVTTAAAAAEGVLLRMSDFSNIPVTAGTVYTCSAWLYAPVASVGKKLRIVLDYFTGGGAFVAETNSGAGITLVEGWQRITFTDAAAPATSAGVRFQIYTPSNQGIFDFWVDMIQVEATSVATTAIQNNAETLATVTRNVDVFSAPFTYAPQNMTAYVKFIDQGMFIYPGSRPLLLSNAASAVPAFLLYTAATPEYRVQHAESGSSVESVTGVSSTIGDTVELRAVLYADGSVLIGMSKNAGAETLGAQSAVLTLTSAWAGTNLYMGGDAVPNTGPNGLILVRVMSGTRTMAQCRTG